MRKYLASLTIGFFIFCIAGMAGATSVGIIGADDNSSVLGVQSYLTDLGMFSNVDILAYGDSAGTDLATLNNYDSVLVYSNQDTFDSGLGNILDNYVDSGGGLVMATFTWQGNIDFAGTDILDTGYSPFVSAGWGNYSPANLGWHDTSSSVFKGVNNISGYYRDEVELTSGASLLASWDDGKEFVAMNAAQNIIGISLFPGIGWWDDPTGDFDVLFGNSLEYVSSGPAPVPEPATILLLGTGLIGLAGFRRKLRKKAN